MSDTLSPAERYAAARQNHLTPDLDDFRASLRFDLDAFQIEACGHVEAGRSVLVAAPTGAGKTVVAEFAIFRAMRQERGKVFYTAPMKALSNQKFRELVDVYGPDDVGLLTGDVNVNAGARIVVMTTEVLRNMLYADSALLTDLEAVVMDEVHYLGDRFRGAVWEEVIIHLPRRVHMVSLSATVSNAEEFGDWLQTVRGDTAVVVSEHRPTPLYQHMLVRSRLVDLFDSSVAGTARRVNPELGRLTSGSRGPSTPNRGRRQPPPGRGRPSPAGEGRLDRGRVVELLDEENLLPAIVFVFSRIGCDAAVGQVMRSGVRLTTAEEREEIRSIVDERCRTLQDEDLGVLGYWDWLEGLQRGVAAHHAGLLPIFKEVVEELFQRRLVRVVFATETLALGINMPARTVVIEKLEKFNGEARVPVTAGEYTQLTGRAGRRGIDVEGHAVVQWADGVDPQSVASLASRRTYPLISSFRPTYNMAINLTGRYGRARTREILESSFAQFQADRAVVSLAATVRQQEESLTGYEDAMRCHVGDFTEYAEIRRRLTDLERLNRGAGATEAAGRAVHQLRSQLRRHPCHGCPDREKHARWAERWWKLRRKTDQLSGQIRSRTGAVARVFDRVTDVLTELGYLREDGDRTVIAGPGRTLSRIYGERDLLVSEALRRGIWEGIDPAALAALVCALVFEPRREELGPGPQGPKGVFRRVFPATLELWSGLDELERAHDLTGSSAPSAGLSTAMHAWARGASLDKALYDADMAAGDFVRWSKQTIDLLDQISLVADAPLGGTARAAIDLIRRGIVAHSTVA